MPITYDAAEDIWELTDLSDEEKKSLMSIAREEILHFFGESLAHRLVQMARETGILPPDDDDDEDDDELEGMEKERMFNA